MSGGFLARLRNLFTTGEFRGRYGDGEKKDTVQVETHNGKTLEKKEAFPYGFVAKAKSGKALILCQGGDFNGFEILPLLPGDGVKPPELDDGDVAIYTGEGGSVVLRDAGGIEIAAGGNGKILVANDAANLCKVFLGLIDDIKGAVTNGSPTAQTVSGPTKAKLDARKKEVESLLAEGK